MENVVVTVSEEEMVSSADEWMVGPAPGGLPRVRTGPELALMLRRLRRREARQREGAELTYRQLAAKTGWSHAVIADYFTGKVLPPTDRFDGLVRLLGASPVEQGLLATARDRVEERRYGTPAPPPERSGKDSPVARQLPADVSGFTGRTADLAKLDDLLVAEETAVMISTITGMAGVGKTTLAVHWAHRVRHRFPDGQLYVNLRGYAMDEPMPPIEALAHFLHALGTPAEQIPADVQTAAGLYRSMLADRRTLVVLDNAATADQVRPLLPGSATCVVLVTSRDRLSSLAAHDGARRLMLDLLTADEAHALLVRLLGADLVVAEPDAAVELARTCSGLPLALRLAAANLTSHPRPSIAGHVRALRGQNRLAALEIDGDDHLGVRRAFDLSFRTLDADSQRLFLLLGLVPGPDVTAPAAAVLTGVDVPVAARQLNRLVAAHLLSHPVPERYTCHDLLRRYATDRATADGLSEDGRLATRRLVDWYLRCADAAAHVLYPHRVRLPVPATGAGPEPTFDEAGALAWLDAERANLVAAIQHAATATPRSPAWLLTDTLRGYFWLRMHTVDWTRCTQAALTAAEAEGDLRAQAATLLSIGDLHHRQSRHHAAIELLTRALELGRRSGWLEVQAAALGFLGSVHRDCGMMREAADFHGRSLALYRELGSTYGEAVALSCLGRACRQLGELSAAAEHHGRALTLYRRVGSRQGEGISLHDLGQLSHARGRPEEAVGYLERALCLARENGDLGNESYTLSHLAAVHCEAGRFARAAELGVRAVAVAGDAGDRRAQAEALNTLAEIQRRTGHHQDAAEYHGRAVELARTTGDQYREVEALLGLAATHRAIGELDRAQEHAEKAVAIANHVGFRLLGERAGTILAAVRGSTLGRD